MQVTFGPAIRGGRLARPLPRGPCCAGRGIWVPDLLSSRLKRVGTELRTPGGAGRHDLVGDLGGNPFKSVDDFETAAVPRRYEGTLLASPCFIACGALGTLTALRLAICECTFPASLRSRAARAVLPWCITSHTPTIRPTGGLAVRLGGAFRQTGLPVGAVVRQQLEAARGELGKQSFCATPAQSPVRRTPRPGRSSRIASSRFLFRPDRVVPSPPLRSGSGWQWPRAPKAQWRHSKRLEMQEFETQKHRGHDAGAPDHALEAVQARS
jgi:hypothetical protein